ncbi:glutamine--fructose-6-phosphate transaminase (isomerizing) [Halochromatium roseum]|uniref:glutamine--fructose-6-phosphate transaminase (isomerizing) n=1 Tax=Halochromatium roseum TaxID=391920 RepID=UPI0019124D4A|nr:glutamine--fructose-6-phosphate transaminase (isomerizing) [Halochromatium roseum]MBK5940209.1 glutamine--fructose-6-phosphate transaminase (isomerizing) [Halochromatium roseum]
MCGIVGYIGHEPAVSRLLGGLRELEYRGYDSAGIALLQADGLRCFKAVGKLSNLAAKLGDFESCGPVTAIGHTRWATHGKPTEANAHPHGLTHSQVVHNGIIENHVALRAALQTPFLSQTDSEVIVHLFERHLALRTGVEDPALAAFRATLDDLEGAYAILLISETEPGRIFFARKGSPLQLGFAEGGCHFASSDAPLVGLCTEALYLEDGQWGVANAEALILFDALGREVEPSSRLLPATSLAARKEGFRYFMEKEIYEQPRVLADILTGRLRNGAVVLDELGLQWLLPISSVTLCACGTSYHAALAGSYLLERLARVPARVEIASEFRYREPVLDPTGLFVVISQSGETADTLEAIKLAKTQGLATLALCNVDNSSIVREAARTLLLRAGIEKGVASTKAFSAQVLTLWLLALYWGQARGLLAGERHAIELAALNAVRDVMRVQRGTHERIQRLSKRYLHGHGFFFIGRDLFYPLALEGALKLKEISYLHAEGYPAGEMKHGPIALADAELFTIALMARSSLYEKVKSNVEELSAREATIIAISTEQFDLADDLIQIRPYAHPMLEFFEMLVVVQLLAMEIAVRLGNDVDMPRNLAKSVTVE